MLYVIYNFSINLRYDNEEDKSELLEDSLFLCTFLHLPNFEIHKSLSKYNYLSVHLHLYLTLFGGETPELAGLLSCHYCHFTGSMTSWSKSTSTGQNDFPFKNYYYGACNVPASLLTAGDRGESRSPTLRMLTFCWRRRMANKPAHTVCCDRGTLRQRGEPPKPSMTRCSHMLGPANSGMEHWV